MVQSMKFYVSFRSVHEIRSSLHHRNVKSGRKIIFTACKFTHYFVTFNLLRVTTSDRIWEKKTFQETTNELDWRTARREANCAHEK